MINSIKSEFAKILTIRSTYAIIALCLALEAIASGYGGGFHASAPQLADPAHLAGEVSSAINLLSAFIPLIGILIVTHEFRYNTIAYTLTAARSRTQVLLSKFIVVSMLAIVLTTIFILLSPLFVWVGAALKGHTLAHQSFPFMDLLPRLLFTGWAYAMVGLVISFIARIQVAAVVVYFLLPGTVEPLLSALVKSIKNYLPYTAIDGVINTHSLSHAESALVATAWIVGTGIIAWALFVKRDAS